MEYIYIYIYIVKDKMDHIYHLSIYQLLHMITKYFTIIR